MTMQLNERPRGGRRWSFDRDAAIETAMLLFWRHGYEGVAVGDLTKAIGVAPPSLYAAFGSKAGLYERALARYEEKIGRLDTERIGSSKSLPDAVRVLLESAVKTVTHRHDERGCMISSGGVACHPDHAAVARDAAERREALRLQIMRALAPFADGDQLHRLSRHLSAVMQGISIQARDGIGARELYDLVDDVVEGVSARLANR